MKYFIYTILFLGCFAVSCSNSKEVIEGSNQEEESITSKANNSPEETASLKDTQNSSDQANVSVPDSLFAYVKRTSCFGKCPAYTLTIYKSGYTTYEGRSSVPKKGKYETILSEEKMEAIQKIAQSIHLFELKDKYVNEHITDVPTTYIRVQFNGKEKSIEANYNIPKSLLRFRDYLDQIRQDTDWDLIEGGAPRK